MSSVNFILKWLFERYYIDLIFSPVLVFIKICKELWVSVEKKNQVYLLESLKVLHLLLLNIGVLKFFVTRSFIIIPYIRKPQINLA